MAVTSSIDHNEVAQFSALAGSWWDKSGPFKILHQINPIRLQYIVTKIEESFGPIAQGLEIIDVGCGGGLISVPLRKMGAKVTGLDASSENISAASAYAMNQGLDIKYICGAVEEHVGQYDVVLCLEVVEHAADLQFFMQHVTKLIKRGGVLIVSTINRTTKAKLFAIGIGEYIFGWVPKGTHEAEKFVKPSELSKCLEGTGFAIHQLDGMIYNPFFNIWEICDDIDVNYFACIQ